MSTYNDGWNDHAPRASVLVHTDTPSAKVTYRGEDGAKFSVIVRQKRFWAPQRHGRKNHDSSRQAAPEI